MGGYGLPLIIPAAAGGPGQGVESELFYVERTTNLLITDATVGNLFIGTPPLVFDGSTRILIEFFSPSVTIQPDPLNDAGIVVSIWDGTVGGGTELGRLVDSRGWSDSARQTTVNVIFGRRFITPAAGTHSYNIGGRLAGSGSVNLQGGTGVGDDTDPAYLRISSIAS